MAISHLTRRLLRPTTTTTAGRLLPGTSFPNPHAHAHNPLLLLHPHRRFSTAPQPDSEAAAGAAPTPPSLESMKHQEIEGPTYGGAGHVAARRRGAAGASIFSGAAPVEVELAAAVQGVAAFAFPFTAALVLRRLIKPIALFQRMEANGRLQVLTLCLQATKNVNLTLLRTRLVAISCALGVSVRSVAAILMR